MKRAFTRKTLLILCWSIVWGLCLVAISSIGFSEHGMVRRHSTGTVLFFAPIYAFTVWILGGLAIALIVKFVEGIGMLK